MATRYWVGGTATWDGTAGSKWSTASGGSGGVAVPTTADVVFFDASSGAGTVTIGSGTAVCSTLTMTGFTGTLAFGSNSITVAGSGTPYTGSSTLNVTGTPLIKSSYAGTNSRAITTNTTTEANSISFEILAGSGNIGILSVVRSLIFNTGSFTGRYTDLACTFYGDLLFKSGMTISSGSIAVRTFAATSGIQKITSGTINLNFPITFAGTATYQLQDAVAIGTTVTVPIILTSGTLDLNNFTLTHFGTFTSSNSNTRSIAFGSTGSYVNIFNGSTTLWNFATLTNFTTTGTSSAQFTPGSSTTVIISHGTSAGGSEANAISFTFNGGFSATVNFGSSYILDLTVSSSNTYTNTTPTIYGSYSQSNTTNFTSLTLSSTSTSRINFIGSNLGSLPPVVNVSGGAASIYKISSINPSYLTTWNVSSSFDTNGGNLSCNSFNFNNSNTKIITVSSGNYIEVSNNSGGSGAFVGSMVGTTLNLTGSEVRFNSNGSFNIPNATFPSVTIKRSASALQTLTIGSLGNTQTITNLLIDNSPSNAFSAKIQLVAGSILNVSSLSIDGNSSRINLLAGGTLSKSSGTVTTSYLNISNNIATGGATWLAPTTNGNVDGGGNVGWSFAAISATNGNFLAFF